MGLLLLCVCQMTSVGDLVHFSIPFPGQAEVFLVSEQALGFPCEGKQLDDVSVPSTAGRVSFEWCPSHPLQQPRYVGTLQTKRRATNTPEQGFASLFYSAGIICIYQSPLCVKIFLILLYCYIAFTLSVEVTALNSSKHYMIILSLTIKSFERLCMRGNIKINWIELWLHLPTFLVQKPLEQKV